MPEDLLEQILSQLSRNQQNTILKDFWHFFPGKAAESTRSLYELFKKQHNRDKKEIIRNRTLLIAFLFGLSHLQSFLSEKFPNAKIKIKKDKIRISIIMPYDYFLDTTKVRSYLSSKTSLPFISWLFLKETNDKKNFLPIKIESEYSIHEQKLTDSYKRIQERWTTLMKKLFPLYFDLSNDDEQRLNHLLSVDEKTSPNSFQQLRKLALLKFALEQDEFEQISEYHILKVKTRHESTIEEAMFDEWNQTGDIKFTPSKQKENLERYVKPYLTDFMEDEKPYEAPTIYYQVENPNLVIEDEAHLKLVKETEEFFSDPFFMLFMLKQVSNRKKDLSILDVYFLSKNSFAYYLTNKNDLYRAWIKKCTSNPMLHEKLYQSVFPELHIPSSSKQTLQIQVSELDLQASGKSLEEYIQEAVFQHELSRVKQQLLDRIENIGKKESSAALRKMIFHAWLLRCKQGLGDQVRKDELERYLTFLKNRQVLLEKLRSLGEQKHSSITFRFSIHLHHVFRFQESNLFSITPLSWSEQVA